MKESIIQNWLNELSELEQIIVHSPKKDNYSIFKNMLGWEWEWEQIETAILKADRKRTFQRFQKKVTTNV